VLQQTPGMISAPPLLTFLLMVVSGWVNRHQLIVVDFLQAENRMLKERLRGKRIPFCGRGAGAACSEGEGGGALSGLEAFAVAALIPVAWTAQRFRPTAVSLDGEL
jgi:hypothetical protein